MTLDLDALEAAARAADRWGAWAIWRDLTDGGFVHVGNLEGIIPEGETVTPDDAEPNAIAKCYTPEIAEHIAAFDPPTVLALIAKLREAEAKMPPCDGGCSYGIGPEETCSAHGRPPAEIWGIVASVAAERDAVQGQLGEAEAVIEKVREIVEPPKPFELGKSMMRSFDRMIGDRRTLATYKPTNQEGGNDGT